MTQKPKRSPAEEILAMRKALTPEILAMPDTRRKKKAPPAPIRRSGEKPRSSPTNEEFENGATFLGATRPAVPSTAVPRTAAVTERSFGPKPQPREQNTRPQPRTYAPRQPKAIPGPLLDDVPIRLSKLMTIRGLCSRREADDLIARGWIKVDGVVVDQLGTKCLPTAKVELHPQAQEDLNGLVTILLNKPIGYVSSQPELGYDPAVILIKQDSQVAGIGDPALLNKHFDGLAPAGRLDIDSQGLLVFTQNGQMAKKLIGENSEIEKEYLVRVEGKLSESDLKLLNHGLELDGVKLRPAKVEWLNSDQLRFVLKEGRKRQIRRMCELVGLHVIGLKRVRIGNVRLGRLPEGQWRFLGPDEMF